MRPVEDDVRVVLPTNLESDPLWSRLKGRVNNELERLESKEQVFYPYYYQGCKVSTLLLLRVCSKQGPEPVPMFKLGMVTIASVRLKNPMINRSW